MNLHDLTRGIPKDTWDVADGPAGSVRCPLCESWVPLYAGIVDDWLINSCPTCYASIAVQPAEAELTKKEPCSICPLSGLPCPTPCSSLHFCSLYGSYKRNEPTDAEYAALKMAELEEGCSVTAGSLDTTAFYESAERQRVERSAE